MQQQIKIPQRDGKSRVEKALRNVPKDGAWHRILTMGFTVAEQTARGYNVPGGQWAFGYTHETNDQNELVSVLWVQWNG